MVICLWCSFLVNKVCLRPQHAPLICLLCCDPTLSPSPALPQVHCSNGVPRHLQQSLKLCNRGCSLLPLNNGSVPGHLMQRWRRKDVVPLQKIRRTTVLELEFVVAAYGVWCGVVWWSQLHVRSAPVVRSTPLSLTQTRLKRRIPKLKRQRFSKDVCLVPCSAAHRICVSIPFSADCSSWSLSSAGCWSEGLRRRWEIRALK